MYKSLFVFSCYIALSMVAYGQVTHSLSFSISDLTFEEIDKHIKIEMPNLSSGDKVGDPDLPPFFPGVKAWAKEYRNGDWFCAYKLDEFQVYFIFTKTENLSNVDDLKIIFPNNDIVFFRSKKLLDMVGYDWASNIY